MAQGKAWNKKKVIESLKPYFLLGCNRRKACKHASFDNTTLSKWEVKCPELSIKIDSWISRPNMKAREVWIKEIEKGSYKASKEWLEKREKKEFGNSVDVTAKGDKERPIAIRIIDSYKDD